MELEQVPLEWLCETMRLDRIAMTDSNRKGLGIIYDEPSWIEGIDPAMDGSGADIWLLDGSSITVEMTDKRFSFYIPKET
ncbi:MAG: hypothetical protein QNI84_14055 [Henriciella sp.]|nr:hypothetical protein [Henriciella sp.]